MGDRGHNSVGCHYSAQEYPYELFLAFCLVAETLLYMCAELLMVHNLKFN